MVIRGGENIYPREIEDYLFDTRRFRTCRCSASPTIDMARSYALGCGCGPGETLSADELRAFCHGQIAHNKVPRYVEFVTEFPMTVTGKAQKFLMRRAVEERLGLRKAETA